MSLNVIFGPRKVTCIDSQKNQKLTNIDTFDLKHMEVHIFQKSEKAENCDFEEAIYRAYLCLFGQTQKQGAGMVQNSSHVEFLMNSSF